MGPDPCEIQKKRQTSMKQKKNLVTETAKTSGTQKGEWSDCTNKEGGWGGPFLGGTWWGLRRRTTSYGVINPQKKTCGASQGTVRMCERAN